MTKQYGEVICLCCGKRVEVSLMNGEWRRGYHHGRNGKACSGSRMSVIDSSVLKKVKV